MATVTEISEMSADLAVLVAECGEETCLQERGDLGPLLSVYAEQLADVAKALHARDLPALAAALHQTGAESGERADLQLLYEYGAGTGWAAAQETATGALAGREPDLTRARSLIARLDASRPGWRDSDTWADDDDDGDGDD